MDAPRSFNQHIFFDAKGVYYGTDDGYQDDSLGEFEKFERLCASIDPARRQDIHFVGAVGGLYSLNLMTCFRPTKVTFFDINPHAIAYLKVIRRVFGLSASKREFLDRLSNADFEVDGEAEARIRENLALKQKNALPLSRGSAYKRSLERSWQYALDNFEIARALLTEVPLNMLVASIESPELAELLRTDENLWLYCSNIAEFTYSELHIARPQNAVVTAIIYPGQVDILDLAPFGDTPVTVHCSIPMRAARDDEQLPPAEQPSPEPDARARALARRCKAAGLGSQSRILDVGCGHGRLALALLGALEGRGEYEGFDCHREHIGFAKQHAMAVDPRFTFHIANLRNRIYNPAGSLDPRAFTFPYVDERFDVVAMFDLSTYLLPAELRRYVHEAARVLGAGGKLLLGAHLLDADTGMTPPPFCFADGEVSASQPHRGGKLGYRIEWIRELLEVAGLELETLTPGAWRGADAELDEDVIVAVRVR